MAPVLEGVRVVELTEALAGPYAAMLLGDLGADVIKVERPGTGDQSRGWGPPFVGTESAYFLAANRNKRSIVLDYKKPADLRILHRLLRTADVFLCNQPALETLRQAELDSASVAKRYPSLIYCSITGYGWSGPNEGRLGYDILAQAEAGVMSFTGEPSGEPMRFPVAIADITTGIYAAMGILGALYRRTKTGSGEFLDMSLFDSQLTWLANVGSSYLNAEVAPERLGNAHPNIVPYQVFRAADGLCFALGVGTATIWDKLLSVIDIGAQIATDQRFATNANRIQHRAELIPLLQSQFHSRSRAEWLRILGELNIPAAPIQTVSEALADPQTLARHLIVELEHPTLGVVRSIANPIRYTREPLCYRLAPPLLGEHTQEIIGELQENDGSN